MTVTLQLLGHPTPDTLLQTAPLHKLKPHGTHKIPVVVNEISSVRRDMHGNSLARVSTKRSDNKELHTDGAK
jgi:hypothetical protein